MSLKQTDVSSIIIRGPNITDVMKGDCPWCGRRDIVVDMATRSCMNCGGYVAPVVQSQVGTSTYAERSVSKVAYWDDILGRVQSADSGDVIYVNEGPSMTGVDTQVSYTYLQNILRCCRVKNVTLRHVRPYENSWLANQLRDWERKTNVRLSRPGENETLSLEESGMVESMTKQFADQVSIIMELYGDDRSAIGLLAPDSKRHRFKAKTRRMLAGSRPDMTVKQKCMVEAMALDKYDSSVSEYYNTRDAEEEYDREVAECSENKACAMCNDAESVSRMLNVPGGHCDDEEIRALQGYFMYNMAFIGILILTAFLSLYGIAVGLSADRWFMIMTLGVYDLVFRLKFKEKFG